MQAVLLKQPGDRGNLYIGDADKPHPKSDELLIRVHAFGLNRADINQRKGNYPPPSGSSSILGMEVSGHIEDMSAIVSSTSLKVGDRVMALLTGGGYAEYATAHIGCVLLIPENLSYEEGAGIMEVYITAYQLCRYIGRVSDEELVLIHAGASGVGTAAIQLCRLFNARPIVTAGTQEKLEHCKQLGAHAAFNYKSGSWPSDIVGVAKEAGRDGVQLLLDCVGASHFNGNLDVLGLDSRWVIYGLMSGSEVDKLNLSTLVKKRLTITATTLRNRQQAYKTQLILDFAGEVLAGLTSGRLRPMIDRVYDWHDISDAHQYLEEDKSMGKVVCRVL